MSLRNPNVWTIAIPIAVSLIIPAASATAPSHPPATVPLAVTFDRSEADAALAIVDTINRGVEPTAAQLAALFGSRPYKRLRERENSMNRPFTDQEFIAYLRSPAVRSQAPALRSILSRWTRPAVMAAARRAAAYLPAGSTFRATIFPMIKIKPNTFVFDLAADPSLFYALDPAEPPAKFANTLAHEMNHVGLAQNCPTPTSGGAPGIIKLRHWVGAFGEGLAMLAAAGGPRVHPHAESSPAERALWDSEVLKVDQYMREQDRFFRAVADGSAGDDAAVDKKMFGYFGAAQGPWYTVGDRMAVTIERNLGHRAVVEAFCHTNGLLQTYNRAARLEKVRSGRSLPIWDPELAKALAT